jgi:hypothetical protein
MSEHSPVYAASNPKYRDTETSPPASPNYDNSGRTSRPCWIAIPEPEDSSCDIGWHVFDVVNDDGLYCSRPA